MDITHLIEALAYAIFIAIGAIVVVAAVIWRKFRNFMVEELSAKLISPIKTEVEDLKGRMDKMERRIEITETRQLENQTSIQQKFETIIRDVADLKGRLEGMLGKFDLYLKLGEKKYGNENR